MNDISLCLVTKLPSFPPSFPTLAFSLGLGSPREHQRSVRSDEGEGIQAGVLFFWRNYWLWRG